MDDYQRSSRRLALIEPAILSAAKIRHARALQHLKEGFNRRVLMLDATIRQIHHQVDQAEGRPLSAGQISELAIFVNSFWLNVCGALDNLAWAVNYEFGIIPTAAEEGGPARLQIKLFHKRFRTALAEQQPELAKGIAPFEGWYGELAEMRDPGAHRIPIYPIPGVMDSTTAAEAERLYAEGSALIEAGSWDEGMELIHQGHNLGSYQPWIALSHNGRIELRNLLVEVRRDDEQFINISNIILRALFK